MLIIRIPNKVPLIFGNSQTLKTLYRTLIDPSKETLIDPFKVPFKETLIDPFKVPL